MSNGSTALDRDNVMVTTELLFGYLVGKTRSQVLSFPDNQIVGETNSFWAQVRDVFFQLKIVNLEGLFCQVQYIQFNSDSKILLNE